MNKEDMRQVLRSALDEMHSLIRTMIQEEVGRQLYNTNRLPELVERAIEKRVEAATQRAITQRVAGIVTRDLRVQLSLKGDGK